MKPLRYIAIIPARYASTRFPAKPLALLDGKPIIQWVYERVKQSFEKVVVATDDDRILQCVNSFGGEAVMTSTEHKSGTDRIWEALNIIGPTDYDVIVNVQGDEPFIQSSQLESLKECFNDEKTQIATLVMPFGEQVDWEMVENPNSPKVVVDNYGFALYFSRSVIPFVRGEEQKNWPQKFPFYKHIGLYAYRKEILEKITSMNQTSLEKAESLEQLRWLQNGLKIKTKETSLETIGIDTPDDLRRAEEYLMKIK